MLKGPPLARLTQCSDVSREAAESLTATASPVQRWLLIERTGAWGRDAVPTALAEALAPGVAAHLMAGWAANGVRPMLVRRPGKHPRGDRRPAVLCGNPFTGSMVALAVDGVAGLAPLRDVGAIDAAAARGAPVAAPLFLVCTHGAKDLCCATAGRPIAAALAQAHPVSTWECSHVGGDRFAGNLVVAPWGEYHGRVDAVTALHIADAAVGDVVRLANFRGRATYDLWQQAAEIGVRARTGLVRREQVTCRASVVHADHSARVVVDSALGGFVVTVLRGRASAQPASHCRAPLVPVTHIAETIVPLPAGQDG